MSRIHKVKIVADGENWNKVRPIECCLDQSSFVWLCIEQDGKTINIDRSMLLQIIEADRELRLIRETQKKESEKEP